MTSYPIWELWMTLFVISHSHKPPPLQVSHCSSVSHRDLLSLVSRLTPLFSLLSNPHITTQYVTTWHVICRYTSVVTGSRCWLLRMSPIVPCGITQKVCDHDELRNSQCVPSPTGRCRKRSGTQTTNLQPHTQVILCANRLPCHVCLNSTWCIRQGGFL